LKTIPADIGASCAVIVRTNNLVQYFTEALQRAGIACEAEQPIDLPPDWKTTMLLIGLLANPDNDTLARWLIEIRQGASAAQAAQKQALQGSTSINRAVLALPYGLTACQLPPYLTSVSAESQARVQAVLETMPERATVQELVLAMADEKFRIEQKQNNGVTVTTYHRAKGREFDLVCLAAFEDGVIPSRQSLGSETLLAEERRLAFVGITRAIKACYISASCGRFNQFKKKVDEALPSRFLKDAGLAHALEF